jgi:hypothetical protein
MRHRRHGIKRDDMAAYADGDELEEREIARSSKFPIVCREALAVEFGLRQTTLWGVTVAIRRISPGRDAGHIEHAEHGFAAQQRDVEPAAIAASTCNLESRRQTRPITHGSIAERNPAAFYSC